MQISVRAAALRAAIERTTGAVAEVTRNGARVRISAPTPPGDAATWDRLLIVLRGTDQWGAGDATGCHRVWAEIVEGEL